MKAGIYCYFCRIKPFAVNRKQFRIVSLSVTVALATLVAVQTWSLSRMYADRREEFVRKVTLAMSRAAYDELLLGKKKPVRTIASFASSGNIDSIRLDMVGTVSVRNLPGAGKVISLGQKADTLKMQIGIRQGGRSRMIRHELRMPSIYALTLDLARYDSLLTRNLRDMDIDLPHRVELVGGGEDDAQAGGDSILLRGDTLVRNRVLASVPEDALPIADPVEFTCRVTADDAVQFRLTIESPDRRLLRDMSGIVVSSLLMLLVVACVLIYLLRMLFRQKTLEEMRMDFTHNITHELKTPIAVANAANDALLDFSAAEDPHKRRRYLGIIRSELAALSGMVQRILTMSLEEREDFRLRREPTDIAALLEEIAAEYRLRASKPCEIVVAAEPPGGRFPLDRFHTMHLVGNLVDNALKYSGAEVRIELRAAVRDGALHLSVADTGCGIDRTAQGHIFEKFYRVPTGDRHDVKGFGLGLYYVRMIVVRYGGAIRVRSVLGRGTTFSITIPYHE